MDQALFRQQKPCRRKEQGKPAQSRAFLRSDAAACRMSRRDFRAPAGRAVKC
jgi:hypothetical protein